MAKEVREPGFQCLPLGRKTWWLLLVLEDASRGWGMLTDGVKARWWWWGWRWVVCAGVAGIMRDLARMLLLSTSVPFMYWSPRVGQEGKVGDACGEGWKAWD